MRENGKLTVKLKARLGVNCDDDGVTRSNTPPNDDDDTCTFDAIKFKPGLVNENDDGR